MKVRLWHKTVAVALLPLAFGVVYFVCLGALLHDTYEASLRETAARKSFDAADQLLHKSFNVVTAVWQYSMSLKADDLQRYHDTRAEILKLADESRPTGKMSPSLKAALEKGKAQLLYTLTYADKAIKLFPHRDDPMVQLKQAGQLRALLPALGETKSAWADIRKEIDKTVKTSENDLSGRFSQIRALIIFGMVLSAAVSLFAAFSLQKSVVRRLAQLSDFSARLLKREPEQTPAQIPEQTPAQTPASAAAVGDEIGDLERAYQLMATQISEALRHERAIVDNAADVIFSLAPDGTFLSVSPAVQAVWHFAQSDLIGKNVIELIPQKAHSAFQEHLRAAMSSNRPYVFESDVVTRAGGRLDMRFSAQHPPDSERLFCVAHDISEMVSREEQLRADEERFRIITERMPGTLFLVDNEFNIVRSNQEAANITGMTMHELAGKNLSQLFKNEPRVGAPQLLHKADGGTAWVEMTIDRFQYQGEQGHLAVLLDVTERVEFQHMRDSLIAMLVHDIGTPLSTMQGVFKLLSIGKYGPLSDNGLTQAELGNHEATQLIRLFKDFVSIERHGAVRLSINKEAVQLHAVLQQSAEAMRPLASQTNIEIAVDDTTDAFIRADQQKVSQVVISLLSNAIGVSPARSIIRILTTVKGDWVEIVIKDSGRQMPPAAIDAIFDPSDIPDLGLVIARSVVEGHGGTIGARGGTDGGRELWFTMPRANDDQDRITD